MTDLCLSRSEIAELTRARKRADQVAFLRTNGIRHYVDLHGWPVVLRSVVEDTAPAATAAPTWKPNKAA
ncbi:hypothetical protein ASD78_12075 [Lysobacter sp. Root667]|uniref:DUF4224 domain-containing protein n=1 Tax=Lysobacter sp. Root667 TaxID=1736581 RepID=UPI0006F40BDF|nr:DUF4224 domain-containing protein [Lysobacter sp. Root667]KRA74225.1 hypothetical protein ASD78_12075 [Lysobacter sp. Root667]